MLDIKNFHDYSIPGAKQISFNPYESNGGSVIAIAGNDYAIIAADGRLSSGYNIQTRDQSKLFGLSNKTVLGSTGCWCDTLALTSLVNAKMQMYLHSHHKVMSTNAVAQMLSTLMYHRRFFPYYVSNVLAGLDENGEGIIGSYDPIGHLEISKYKAGGSAGSLLQPLLDSRIGYKNQHNVEKVPISKERALKTVIDGFLSAAERDIYTGDECLVKIITKDGIETTTIKLRKD